VWQVDKRLRSLVSLLSPYRPPGDIVPGHTTVHAAVQHLLFDRVERGMDQVRCSGHAGAPGLCL
jgi:hypothetical protein